MRLRYIFSLVGLLVSIAAFFLSLYCPAWITSIPARKLPDFAGVQRIADNVLPSGNETINSIFTNESTYAFKALIKKSSRKQLIESLSPSALSFYERLMSWQEDRKTKILFPVKDKRGQPTEMLLILFAVLHEDGALSLPFKNHIEKQLIDAPEKNWGSFEKTTLALLYLAKRLKFSDLKDVLVLVNESWELTTIAAFFQKYSEHHNNLLKIMRSITSKDLNGFLDYLAQWEEKGIPDLLSARESNYGALNYLLKRQVVVGRDWPKWINRDLYIIKFIDNFYKNNHAETVLIKYALMFISMFCFLLFFNLLTGNVLPSYFILFAAFSLFMVLIIGLNLEPGNLTRPELPSLKFSHAVSDKIFDQEPTSQGEANMENQALQVAFTILFFLIQSFLFFMSKNQIRRVQRQNEPAQVKIKLLENEDSLFDMGLYVGLAGTILSLIFLSLGWANIGLMSAYTSTLFGIIGVALIKLLYLRPYKRILILQVMGGESNQE